MKIKFYIFILLIFSILNVNAQEKVNADSIETDSLKHRIIYHLSLTGTWSSGNINRDFIDVKLSSEYIRVHIIPEFIFGKINNNLFERDYSLITDLKILPKKQFFGFGFTH